MRQLTVISGKGGTGKTSLTAALASLATNAVIADCDVDAADLHLLLHPRVETTLPFFGLDLAVIDDQRCISCGRCRQACRFGAISEDIEVVGHACEGCGVCAHVCPVDAISLVRRESGQAFISSTRHGPLVHAALHTAEEASGKLVSLVREQARQVASRQGRDLVIIDGPPGIGCPVIAAIAGVDLVLVVTEPTVTAVHDLERILGVAHHFDIPAAVCINKCDLVEEKATGIEDHCREMGVEVAGRLPYDTVVTEAMLHGKTVVEFEENAVTPSIRILWKKVQQMLRSGDP
ncbi:MAG TPA: 4Fe-4S dicluster domain-containing protein [Thermoplasmatales archaeon]|nr:4Fe-4S dicluster domain-containing protein [Thermoplasmatales archaeon]